MTEQTGRLDIPTFKDHYNVLYLTSDLLLDTEVMSGAGGLGVVAGSIATELENNHEHHQTTALFVAMYCSHGYQKQVMQNDVMVPIYERDRFPEATYDTGKRIRLVLADRECVIALRTTANVPTRHTGVLLLDTDLPENPEDIRLITRVLYGERHATAFFDPYHQPWRDVDWMRVLQSAVLGIGAYYAIRELGIRVDFVHCNDSHPVFYPLHRLGEYMRGGLYYNQALERVRKESRYTNHTVLESGNKRYPISHIAAVCGHYAGFDEATLRTVSDDVHMFRMTTASLTLVGPGHANAVSKDHAQIASQNFGYTFHPITNGVYVPQYQDQHFAQLKDPMDIPLIKRKLKLKLYTTLLERAKDAGWVIRDVHAEDWAQAVLLVWARRGQSYKRMGLMWHHNEFELVKKLLDWRHIAVAWGGLVHPDDTEMFREWNKYFRRIRELPNVMPVFNYRLDLIRGPLKSGADVWLNTPWYGYEACGTSWMSAMLNCALVVSIPDGGVLESDKVVRFGSTKQGDWHAQYEHDAEMLWKTLVPEIYHLRENDPRMLRLLYEAKVEAEHLFSATRMVDEYRSFLWK